MITLSSSAKRVFGNKLTKTKHLSSWYQGLGICECNLYDPLALLVSKQAAVGSGLQLDIYRGGAKIKTSWWLCSNQPCIVHTALLYQNALVERKNESLLEKLKLMYITVNYKKNIIQKATNFEPAKFTVRTTVLDRRHNFHLRP